MSTQNDCVKSFTAASAISAYSLITVNSSGQAALATTNDLHVGVAQADVASGDQTPVRLYTPTFLMKAAGAITAGSQVYPAASGKISGSAVGSNIGMACEAATASGDVIEIATLLN